MFLKVLKLVNVSFPYTGWFLDSIRLISCFPVWEKLEIEQSSREFSVTISAPNLKYLNLNGDFGDINVEYGPVLSCVELSSYDIYKKFQIKFVATLIDL